MLRGCILCAHPGVCHPPAPAEQRGVRWCQERGLMSGEAGGIPAPGPAPRLSSPISRQPWEQ